MRVDAGDVVDARRCVFHRVENGARDGDVAQDAVVQFGVRIGQRVEYVGGARLRVAVGVLRKCWRIRDRIASSKRSALPGRTNALPSTPALTSRR